MHRKPWYNVLQALANPATQIVRPRADSDTGTNALLAFGLMRSILAELQNSGLGLDTEGFKHICAGVENAALASLLIRGKGGFESRRQSGLRRKYATDLVQDDGALVRRSMSSPMVAEASNAVSSSPFLRHLFQSIVSSGQEATDTYLGKSVLPARDIPPIPSLLHVPNGAELHAFVRALGVLGDHEGIWSLVQWMVQHKDELWVQVREEIGGRTRWRRMLTAIRVFLEYPHLDPRIRVDARVATEMAPASQDVLTLVRTKIDEVTEWGGWPRAEEVRRYVQARLEPESPAKRRH